MGLGDHLGNVLVTVLDRKTGKLPVGGGTVYDHWEADIASATDYYPGGMPMPGRMINGEISRFGYNGQEKVNEIAGVGNWYTAPFWEYSPLTNTRKNPDPVRNPSVSPYAVFDGNPIWKNDPLGNTPNEYEKDARTGAVRQTGTKGGDEIDYITVKNDPGTKVGDFQLRPPSPDYTYSVPVETKMFGTGIAQYTAYRAPGEKVIGSITDGPIQSVCYECLFIPLPKGAQLFGRGTGLIGATSKTSRILGGASRSVNYYTKAAEAAGYSTELTGARVMAGPFVQASHNIRNLFTGRTLKVLYSNSEATIIGRSWQNQAIGLGLFNIGTSVGAGFYNFSSTDNNSSGSFQFGNYILPISDNLRLGTDGQGGR